jgi:hypothetical protein
MNTHSPNKVPTPYLPLWSDFWINPDDAEFVLDTLCHVRHPKPVDTASQIRQDKIANYVTHVSPAEGFHIFELASIYDAAAHVHILSAEDAAFAHADFKIESQPTE